MLNTYRKTIVSAFADVEQALIAVADTAERERLQPQVVTSSRTAFDIAETRLREGTVDLVTVLITQQALFTAEDNQVVARLARLQAVLSLFQALGGSWLPNPRRVLRTTIDDASGTNNIRARQPRPRGRRRLLLGAVGRRPAATDQERQGGQERRRRQSDDIVPVLAIRRADADVPVYLDGVGTAKALNTVTVRRRSTAS